MARHRGQPAEEEDQEMDEELVALQFNETLSWRAGKPIATGELLRRLEKLSKELADLDQETIDKESLHPVAKELVAHNLLAHKEAGVKAFVASCLVDVLKLCAPEAPFTPKQLKEIFTLFVKVILPALWNPSHAYNAQHKYVLASLTEVKSILLINDINNSEELLLDLFSTFFDGISGTSKSSSGEQVAKDVEFHMIELMATLVDESNSLPSPVLDVIIGQFLRAVPPERKGSKEKTDSGGTQTTLLPKEEPEAYVLAKTVCNLCSDKMARYIGQYFSDVILDVSGKGGHGGGGRKDDDDSDDDNVNGPSEADFKELRKAHLLLRELWRAAPTVLSNVVPQVDAELSADDLSLRLLATETLGDMIAGIGAAGYPPAPTLDPAAYPPLSMNDDIPEHPNASILTTPISPMSFAQTHPQAFQNFVSRKNDKSPLIRSAWTTAVGYIVSTSAGGIGLSREDDAVFVTGLRDKLTDNDEKVRLAAVQAIQMFGFNEIVLKLASAGGATKEGSVLFTLADRCRDKRSSVRVEAMALLGKLWAVASGEIAAGQESVISAFSGIPSRVLNTFYANDPELNVLLERVMFEYLIPLSYPPPPKTKGSKPANGNSQAELSYDQDRVRAERIILLVKDLDHNAKKAFHALQIRQPQFSRVLETFISACDANNGGNPVGNTDTAKSNLKKTIQYLSKFLPDPVRVEADLQSFATWHDRRSYQLIRFTVSPESDFKTMHRAIKELVKRVQGSPRPQMLDTLLPLLYRSAYIMFNKSHLSTFIDCSKSDKHGLGAAAQEITTEISQNNPDLFKTHVGQLCKDLMEGAPTSDQANDPAMVEALKACSSYSKKYPKELPGDRKFTQALTAYAMFGQPAKSAKYAVNVMMARKDDRSLVSATDLLQRVMKDWGYDSPNFVNKLAAVSQLELLASQVTTEANDDIVDMAKDILYNVRTDAKDSDPLWVDDADIDEECQVKSWAVKLIVNRLRGIEDTEEAKELAPAVFKLLRTLLKQQGELCKTKDTPKHHQSRLRLLAGQLFLKLCTQKHFEEVFSPTDFNQLALLTQDPCEMVRRLFLEKLLKYLVQNKLRPRFYSIVFLTAFEPIPEFKNHIETWIRSRARFLREAKQSVMESSIARLISLLAHHPDFSPEAEDLRDHASYLLHYITNVTTETNFGIIYKYAERVKQTLDGINPSESERLYIISDLAQSLLRKWQERKGWSLQVFSGKVGLPAGLYSALPSHQAAQEIAEKQYLPEGVDELLDDLLRSLDKKKKRKSMDERAEGQPAQKRAKAPTRKIVPPKAKLLKEPKASSSKPKASRPKKSRASSSSPPPESADRRRSGRAHKNSSYIERDDSADDEDMLDGVAKWQYYDDDGNPLEEEEDENEDNTPSSNASEDEADVNNKDEDEDGIDDEEDQEDDVQPVEEQEGSELDDVEEEEEPEEKIKASSRKGRSAISATANTRTRSLPSRPLAKEKGQKSKAAPASVAKSKPAPKSRAAGSRATRSRRIAAQDEVEEEED
ncbi:armadillo-type protein [Xylariaceae sp. FL0255]|nr:armadillo-type protein [Xylariaceae sp. FL0255]